MPKIRHAYTHDFTIIANQLICDTALSYKARGLFLYLWHLPDDWNVSLADLQAHSSEDGQASVRRGVAELQAHGYLSFRRIHAPTGGKFVDTEWTLNDMPSLDFPKMDEPKMDEPKMIYPSLGNRNTPKYYPDPRTIKPRTEEVIHPNLPSEGTSMSHDPLSVLRDIVRTIPLSETHTAMRFHDALDEALIRAGMTVLREHAIPDRGDGRSGRVDLLITHPNIIGIEIDAVSPRTKSLFKLRQIDGLRVLVLRSPGPSPEPQDRIDAIIRYPHSHHETPRTQKTPFPTTQDAQAHLKTSILDPAFDAWYAGTVLADVLVYPDLAWQWEQFALDAEANNRAYKSWRAAFQKWLGSRYQERKKTTVAPRDDLAAWAKDYDATHLGER